MNKGNQKGDGPCLSSAVIFVLGKKTKLVV